MITYRPLPLGHPKRKTAYVGRPGTGFSTWEEHHAVNPSTDPKSDMFRPTPIERYISR